MKEWLLSNWYAWRLIFVGRLWHLSLAMTFVEAKLRHLSLAVTFVEANLWHLSLAVTFVKAMLWHLSLAVTFSGTVTFVGTTDVQVNVDTSEVAIPAWVWSLNWCKALMSAEARWSGIGRCRREGDTYRHCIALLWLSIDERDPVGWHHLFLFCFVGRSVCHRSRLFFSKFSDLKTPFINIYKNTEKTYYVYT